MAIEAEGEAGGSYRSSAHTVVFVYVCEPAVSACKRERRDAFSFSPIKNGFVVAPEPHNSAPTAN